MRGGKKKDDGRTKKGDPVPGRGVNVYAKLPISKNTVKKERKWNT